MRIGEKSFLFSDIEGLLMVWFGEGECLGEGDRLRDIGVRDLDLSDGTK